VTSIPLSDIQIQRIKELGGSRSDVKACFSSDAYRNKAFQKLEKKLVDDQRNQLKDYFDNKRVSRLDRLGSKLIKTLVNNDFTQVMTPIIMSKGHLKKMSIDEDHPLAKQIYWLDKNQCLRPMLAPHLYYLLRDLVRLREMPIRIFEIGPCFRKESKGARHASEFTMLNLVEVGLPENSRQARLKELAGIVTQTAGISDYEFETESSEVYGDTLDIVAGEKENSLELGSGAMGPHSLDNAWGITDTWVGIGFGLERLLMISEKEKNISKYGRSLSYLDGVRLNI